MDQIKDIMQNPIGIKKTASIVDAVNKMQQHKISRLIIYESNNPVGIVSEKDILSFFFNSKENKMIKQSIDVIMNDILFEKASMTPKDAAHFMLDNRCSSIAIGSKNSLEGIITKTDLTKYFGQHKKNLFQVNDYMSVHYFSVFTDHILYDVIKTMLGFGISRLVILDSIRNPVGIISAGDIFRSFLENYKFDEIIDTKTLLSKTSVMGSITVGNVMHKGLITIDSQEDLATACQTIIEKNVNALGTNYKNQLAGIFAKRDALLALRDC